MTEYYYVVCHAVVVGRPDFYFGLLDSTLYKHDTLHAFTMKF